jgi:molecular chaperone GrpE (heat shock protein)
MSSPTAAPDPFAAAMQQLRAEAERSVPSPTTQSQRVAPTVPPATAALEARLQQLETALSKKIDDLAKMMATNRDIDLGAQLRKVEEQVTAIRNTESVNQRLFDSLHEELLKYRDNFVHESLQKPFIHDLVHLFDDLSSLAAQLGASAQEGKKRSNVAQWRENLENTIHSLVEILHRFDVEEIEPRETVDRNLHKVVSFEPADYPEEDGRIIMRLKRGFVWRDQLIRAEEVIAKRYG